MPAKGTAEWKGGLQTGTGTFTAGDSIGGGYTFKSRFEDGPGSNPEQLIAAAHAACFSMALSNGLAKAGHQPERLTTTAEVEFVPGKGIVSSTITVRGHIHGLSAGDFQKFAEEAKNGCPVSQALKGNVQLNLKSELDHTH
jgi:lipoyl-dependent peroxiredoxin